MSGSLITEALEINPSLLAFKPRQVALLFKRPVMKVDTVNGDHKTLVLKPEQKTLLFHSIAQYLQRSGFSKTAKKFLSEAKIQDDMRDSSYDLEEIFCKFLEMCNDGRENSKSYKVKDGEVDATSDIEVDGDGEKKKSDKASKSKDVAEVIDVSIPVAVKSKEKKRNKKNTFTLEQEHVSQKVLEETDQGTNNKSKDEKKKKKNKKSSDPIINEEKPKKSDSKTDELQSPKEDETEKENKIISKSHKVKDGKVDATSDIEVDGDGEKKKSDKASKPKDVAEVIDVAVPVDVKSKEKKRNKNDTCTLEQEHVSQKILEETDKGTNNKSKEEKKKKKNKKSSDPSINEEKPKKSDSKNDELQSSKEDETEKENKSSKKRKRLTSEEDAVHPAGEKVVEESKPRKEKSKRRKTSGSEETKVEGEPTDLNSTRSEKEAQKEENSQVNPVDSQKTFGEQVNGLSNGGLEKKEEISAMKTKKEQNDSAEPKTVKHFQRVKVDEVVFSDERLKNNSYWAKDGADIGYGAKAQEILEQVRGRDFRHEKTKKKRGSYRGGQIDLQSHSVKFNYSDEE